MMKVTHTIGQLTREDAQRTQLGGRISHLQGQLDAGLGPHRAVSVLVDRRVGCL